MCNKFVSWVPTQATGQNMTSWAQAILEVVLYDKKREKKKIHDKLDL